MSIGKKIILQDSNSATCRKVSALHGQLGKTDKRSEYFAESQGIPNSIPLQTKAKLFYVREGNSFLKKGAVE